MATYQGMKPMLQFTNFPPPPGERRRRRRKPVKTPDVPKVKSVSLGPAVAHGGAETEEQENLPRPCLKWVSPQFCDDLTENGTHLKPNRRRKKKNAQPLQEVRELFPEAANNVEKSAVKRNPLVFKQNADVPSVFRDRMHKSRSNWCSQDISLYPSTCAPRSKQKLNNSESSDGESTDNEKNDNQVDYKDCVDDQADDMGCDDDQFDDRGYLPNEFDNVGWCDNKFEGDRDCGDDEQLNNDRGCRECPSLSDQQDSHIIQPLSLQCFDDHTVPSVSQQQKQQEESGALNDIHMRLRPSDTTQVTGTQNYSQQQKRENNGFNDMRLRLSDTTQLTETPQLRERGTEISGEDKVPSQTTPKEQEEGSRHYSCRRTTPYDYKKIETEENPNHAEQLAETTTTDPQAACGTDKSNRNISYTGCSMENLSELVKDMSVGDNNDFVDYSEHHAYSMSSASGLMECLDISKKDRSGYSQMCQKSCNRGISSVNTTFKPPAASTPFRLDQCSPTTVLSSLRRDKALLMSYKLSPNTLCSGGFGKKISTPTCTSSQRDQEMSILVKETPEHLWCSPKLTANSFKEQESKIDFKDSFKVSESIIQEVHESNSEVRDKCANESRSFRQQQVCGDVDDIDMTTFNNFDDSDGSAFTRHTAVETSKVSNKSVHPAAIPPTQDSSYNSEGEWSILAKLTPDELWCSPVVKVVDNSFVSQ